MTLLFCRWSQRLDRRVLLKSYFAGCFTSKSFGITSFTDGVERESVFIGKDGVHDLLTGDVLYLTTGEIVLLGEFESGLVLQFGQH